MERERSTAGASPRPTGDEDSREIGRGCGASRTSPPTGEAGALTVGRMIEKRRQRWAEKHDIEYDTRLVEAAAHRILSDRALMDEIYERPYLLIEVAFHIVDKDKETVPFFFNEVQRDFIRQYEEKGTDRPYIVLKGRQQGFTSLITAMQTAFAIVRRNFSGMTLADCADNTRAIFNDKARMVYERLPDLLKPAERFNSKNELFFDKLNSSWRIQVAAEQVGRSRTLNFVHYSEAAFYKCSLAAMQKSIGEACTHDAFRVFESTANGFNEFRELWEGGSCVNLFYGWWRTAEYRTADHRALESISDTWICERVAMLEKMGLDRDQIAWYCRKYESYIDKASIRQEYPCTPEEAFVASGDCVFDVDAINNRLIEVRRLPPPRIGYFTYRKEVEPLTDGAGTVVGYTERLVDIAFKEAPDGYIRLHREPEVKRDKAGNPTGRVPYVLGGDSAGTGQDFFTGKVLDNRDGRTVATLHRQKMDDDLYAEQMYCLGHYYHTALIGIEINYSRVPMRRLSDLGYPHLYLREKTSGMSDVPEKVLGFETNTRTKPIIVAELIARMREDITLECDAATLDEMRTFVRKENGRTEANTGCHDDLVMALAIAHFIRGQQAVSVQAIPREENRMLEELFHYTPEGESEGSFMSWDDF